MDLNSINKIVLPWAWIMGFSNIAKHKYNKVCVFESE